jgi:N-acylneuraminate cytidylyltransferase
VIQGRSVLAVITARGGSKRLPRKNMRELGGKPLILWTVEAAKKSRYIDRLILSSDDNETISACRAAGCEVPFVRPASLAQDSTPGVDPVLHALEAVEPHDYVVLLQPTSPLRSAADIDAAIELCIGKGASSCVSVTACEKNPYWTQTVDSSGRLRPLLKREETGEKSQYYVLNGAVYVAKCDWLKKSRVFAGEDTVAYVMPGERSVDIDTELDLDFCSFLIKRRQHASQ